VIGWVHANLTRVFELGQRPRKLHGPVMRRIYPRLAAVMGCADGVGDDLRNNFHLANAGAIPNGTDVDRCRRLAEAPVPERLRHVFDRPVIVNVAAFHCQKNQQLLLRTPGSCASCTSITTCCSSGPVHSNLNCATWRRTWASRNTCSSRATWTTRTR
jgi:hypothetical protein